MSARAPHPTDIPDEKNFRTWLNGAPPFRVAVSRMEGQHYLLAVDFNVAGTGATLPEAQRDLSRLLYAYFQSYYREGRSVEDAVRPVRRRKRLTIAVATFLWQRLGKYAPHECPDCDDDLPGAVLGHPA